MVIRDPNTHEIVRSPAQHDRIIDAALAMALSGVQSPEFQPPQPVVATEPTLQERIETMRIRARHDEQHGLRHFATRGEATTELTEDTGAAEPLPPIVARARLSQLRANRGTYRKPTSEPYADLGGRKPEPSEDEPMLTKILTSGFDPGVGKTVSGTRVISPDGRRSKFVAERTGEPSGQYQARIRDAEKLIRDGFGARIDPKNQKVSTGLNELGLQIQSNV